MDAQGFGQSDGARGYFETFEEVKDDFIGETIFALGHFELFKHLSFLFKFKVVPNLPLFIFVSWSDWRKCILQNAKARIEQRLAIFNLTVLKKTSTTPDLQLQHGKLKILQSKMPWA